MKILYIQHRHAENETSKPSFLEACGIEQCFLRFASSADHFATISNKTHQHTAVEIHLILDGLQQYQVLNTCYDVPAGHYLLIPADVPHRHIFTRPGTRKYSFSFTSTGNASRLFGFFENRLLCKAATKDAMDSIIGVEAEANFKKEYSTPLIESKIFQFLLYLARDAGIYEGLMPAISGEDPRMRLAKQYIDDNINQSIGCMEVADYCHLSQKQLSRLFVKTMGSSTADYIRGQRILRIKQLLVETNDTLEQISEKMHFSNVYHFNTFFSKYAGVSPGKYRKTHAE